MRALCRDFLHHAADPAAVLAEAVRVLTPGGRLLVIEPNGANPLVALHGRLVAAERGLRASRRPALEALVRALPVSDVTVAMRQPLPLRRLLLHHRFGVPGRVGALTAALGALEATAGRLLGAER